MDSHARASSHSRRWLAAALGPVALVVVAFTAAGALGPQDPNRPPQEKGKMKKGFGKKASEKEALAEPFKGVTTDGKVIPDLFPIRSTGVSTEPVARAAEAFLATLTRDQRAKTTFPVDDPEWRKWMNVHFYVRQGVGFREMSEPQREAATGLLKASLSAKGLKTSRDIMKLNHTLAELTGDFEGYGDDLYWITIMGTPSTTEPWGWQIDGHHLVINYFVLGDQVAMTPAFMGSEPVKALAGKYQGTEVLQAEQNQGLAVINSLTDAQKARAILRPTKDRNDNQTEAWRDNAIVPQAGIKVSELDEAQKAKLLELVAEFVGNMDDGHARVRMEEVKAKLDATTFAWVGKTDADAVFYYRIQSPVILIEFDHQTPVALGRSGPTRQHIHTVVRTPNGNDYGKDLLAEHLRTHPHPPRPAAGE